MVMTPPPTENHPGFTRVAYQLVHFAALWPQPLMVERHLASTAQKAQHCSRSFSYTDPTTRPHVYNLARATSFRCHANKCIHRI